MSTVNIGTRSIKPKGTRSPSSVNTTEPTPHQCNEEFVRRIIESVYYKSASRGFEPDHEMEDWLDAEKEAVQ